MEPDKTKEKRLMGIDFGQKRIGLALCDPLFTFAYPFKTINNDKNLIKNLADLVQFKNVIKVILGIPSDKYKSSSKIIEQIKKLKTKIENQLKIEVVLWDEDYSSAIAQQRVVESVAKKSKRKDKGLIDQNSAAIILQEYLNYAKIKQND